MTTQRRFGIEIEGFGISKDQVRNALVAAGINVEVFGYTHRHIQSWKIVNDSSVHNGNGWEVVSPILKGEEGLAEVIRVAEALDRAGAKVDRSCGFHVHVDAAGVTPAEMKALVERYARFEGDIDAFMPVSRRAGNNVYCRSMQDYTQFLGETNQGNSVFLRRIDEHKRYYKVNLHAVVRHGTIEFRQHSGTRNAQKISNWIEFVLHFVEATLEIFRSQQAAQAAAAQVVAQVAQSTRTEESSPLPSHHSDVRGYWSLTEGQRAIIQRLYQGPATVFDLRQVAAGRGNREMTEMTVVSYISDIRSLCGLDIRKRRGGAYYIPGLSTNPADYTQTRRASRPAPAPTPAPVAPVVNPIPDTLWYGMPAQVVSFYEERTQEFVC